AVLFQDHNLFPHLTAWQNVALGLDPSLRLSEAQKAEVTSALVRVGLSGLERRRPGELSGGQQSRVGLARAMVQAKPLLLLDEAFAALGPALKAEMLALLQDVLTGRDTTLLMVTHDPEDARVLCPQTLVVAGGKVTGPFPTKDMLAAPPPELATYLGTK
ncbi:MAG: ATP-binding cassette domain-containing protein, partial [Spirochaetales bacterium]|nr:ATP-binding cassette domain-containing protein [Spirochaetales bacterium]